MGALKDIVFNPATGLFEDSTNPTAHLTDGEVRKPRRQRQTDPMALQMKPIIRSLYLSGGNRPLEGTTIEMSWYVERAQRVVVTFPSGRSVEFPSACRCQFVVPRRNSYIRIVAHNGKYSTQRTLQLHPQKLSLIHKFFKWLKSHQQ